MVINTELEPHVQKAVDHKIEPLDIMHGELKRMLVEAEEELLMAQQTEDESGEAMDSMERTYWEGQCEAIQAMYTLTYGLYFAIDERDGKNG